ncbi:hypothetical protein L1987_46741 [Smallanthus sonchifolius]|uniref:Uncharacterized protein n=1 Tax=Smallanthus sonchifolius TaxID=185202 RepID=A0ACB9G014_9ASTR|nr:hypothetical protein L1987_46741 [Smallanthus sonchifolius]
MPTQRLSSIVPIYSTNPIEIRVIRKWVPYHRQELCFLFVDEAYAIEGFNDTKSRDYYEGFMRINNCYSIKCYVSISAKRTLRIVDHQASILFGTSTTVVPIDKDAILRGKIIDVALWQDIATSFDEDAATQGPDPVIFAATSLKVLQLGSTSATETYINLGIAQIAGLIQRPALKLIEEISVGGSAVVVKDES